VVKLLLDAAHGGSEATLAIAAEHAPSFSQAALAMRPHGNPDLLRGEALSLLRLGLLGRGRGRLVDDRWLILGRRLVVI